jgi:hypothetical protein
MSGSDMVISSLRGEGALPNREPTLGAQPGRARVAPESPFSQALRGLGREIDRGEARVAAASQLRSYDTQSLIALQVGIYRYTEAVDLASKIVDRATSAVHAVLQGGGR